MYRNAVSNGIQSPMCLIVGRPVSFELGVLPAVLQIFLTSLPGVP